MIIELILASALSGCPNGSCTVSKEVERPKIVVVQPVKKLVTKVKHRHWRLLRRR